MKEESIVRARRSDGKRDERCPRDERQVRRRDSEWEKESRENETQAPSDQEREGLEDGDVELEDDDDDDDQDRIEECEFIDV